MARGIPTFDRCRSGYSLSWLDAMGQRLFEPPNVKGWPGGQTWLNTSTMLGAITSPAALAMGTLWQSPAAESKAAPATARATLTQLVARLTHRPAPADMPEEPAPALAFDAARIIADERVSRPEDLVGALLALYLPGDGRP